jgi:hypothetical protein
MKQKCCGHAGNERLFVSMTSFFIAAFQPTQLRQKQILRPSMKTWWGLEEEMMRVTLCNSEKVLHMEITKEKAELGGKLRHQENVTSFGKPRIITRNLDSRV